MSSSKIITRNDLRDVLNEIVPIMETSIVNEAEDIVETVAPDIVEDYVSSSAFTSAILDVFYPVGSYYETSDTTFNPNTSWGGTWVLESSGKDIVTNSGQATITAATTYTLCTISLEPNTKYIIQASTSGNQGNQQLYGCFLAAAPTPTTWIYSTQRALATSGGGTSNWAYIETSESDTTITLTTYGYYTTSHIEYGKMIAIPLQEDKNIKWHRTA